VYLKTLTLKGFKSFAQPTTFAFEPGVTCVVGPNGSGKSNVVDALAWVMGEQGAKTLRGGKMEDVIFAGTATRGPLGRAEVSLTIDNSDGALPIDYTEVTITRTLFRNGASEYAINGEGCRLLDVQELLSDSGLGREMHVIVGQGQLDQLLRASPEERRGFIEEAAGILKHRRRKEKTLRKLDAMQANLTRVSDLAGELRRQLKPLGRQAEVAREAATVASVVRDARARLLADEILELRRSLDTSTESEQERHAERLVLQDRLDRFKATLATLEQAHGNEEIDRARATAFGLEQAQSKLRALDNLVRQRIDLLTSSTGEMDVTPSVTRELIDSAVTGLDELREVITASEDTHHHATLAATAARVELDRVDENIAQQAALVTAYDLQISQLVGQADSAASKVAAVRGEAARYEAALVAASARAATAATALAEAEAASSSDEGRNTDLAAHYDTAQARVVALEADTELLREALHAREREQGAVQARVQALSLALDQKDGSAALVADRLAGVWGLLAEVLHVEPGYEVAVAAALGSLSDAVVVDHRDAAFRALAHAASGELGRLALVLAEEDAPRSAAPQLPGLVAASSVITAPPGVRALLDEVYIADDIAVAQSGVDTNKPITIVTKDGTVVGRYVVRGGSGRKQSRIELTAEHDRAAARLTELRTEIEREQAALATQREVLSEAKQVAAQALTALREFDAQLAQRTERLNRARVQVEATEAELERWRQAVSAAEIAMADAEQLVQEATLVLETARAVPRPVLDTAARDTALVALDAAREAEVDAKLRAETAKERLRAEERRIQTMESQYENERRAAEEAARRAVIRRHQREAAERVARSVPTALAAVAESVAAARAELARAEQERVGWNDELQALRREEAAVRERLQSVTENLHGLELRIHERKLQLGALLERAESDVNVSEAVLIAEYGPDQPVPADTAEGQAYPYDRDEQKRRLAAAERNLALLGRVNPLALEEFAALEQRHQFLTDQLTDLANTRKDLLTIIADIDGRMESIFTSAFEDTQAAFGQVFPILFPGGNGSITLTDPDNMLLTGIEVSVKPAGKKIERLSLLSGGERSLAAVALLLAIFTARPSPFYVLDEVEAALDDANLGRLLTAFDGLRASSQLIVITHQKRTMEIADALYGVTMRKDGVSAVVGQRVREEREPE